MQIIKDRIRESIEVKNKILENQSIIGQIEEAAKYIIGCFSAGGKVLLCGNGGSASDAMHIAGEFVGRFQRERKALPAIALNGDVTSMTSIANDYGYENVFQRCVEGFMRHGDVLIGISTSGNSVNVYNALNRAKMMGEKTIALLGKDGGKIKTVADIPIIVPSNVTARIQESHIMIGHIICELVENECADISKEE